MVPVVAFVGRPNVRKSTLFNRLAHTRDALVTDSPGLTRGREYGHAEIKGRESIYIDTDGIDGTEDDVETRMAGQSLLAIEEADVTLFTVDTHAGLMPADGAIARHLHPREKPTFLMANKTDGLDPDQVVADFYALGLGEVYPTAASHGRGVLSLLEHVLLPWMKDLTPQEGVDGDAKYWAQFEVEENGEEEEADDFDPQSLPTKLATVGRPSVGKSTLANRIPDEECVVIYDMPGATRGSIYIPMERDGREYVLVDTTDVRKHGKITDAVEKSSVIKTLQAIEDANVVVLMIDAREDISDQDLSLLGFILNSGRSLVIVANKWDDLSQEVEEQVKEALDLRLGFIDFARAHFISALHGGSVGNLFESVREAYDSFTRHVETSMLARIMTIAAEDHQPPLVRGRRVKLKYTHTGGYNPPTVVIYGSQVKDLPDSYKRYLMSYSRKSLDVVGSPIRTQFKEGESPYANKRNTLTPTQTRKRKRLMKHIKKNK